MPLRTQRAVLAAKVEAAEGTAESLLAAQGVLALAATFQRNQDLVARNPLRPTLSQMASIPGRKTGTITSTIECKGSGTAGTAPEWGVFLRSCGFSETISPGVSVTYVPVSTGDPSITTALYMDGIRHLLAGCRSTFTLGGAVGELALFNFSTLGVEESTTDVAILAPTYQTTVPKVLKGLTFTLHGSTSPTVICSSFAIDFGVQLSPRGDFSKTSGYASVFLGDRMPTVNFLVEKPLVATKDWYGILEAGTEANISLALTGSAGNIVTITAPKLQITNINEQDDGGKAMLSIDGKLNLNTGDDELSIVCT